MIYLSFDVEAGGPFPGLFHLCSIGAVPVVRTEGGWNVVEDDGFYVELEPQEGAAEIPAATAVHGLTLEHLSAHGSEPAEACLAFERYVAELAACHGKVKAAAWPISFDHPFVGWLSQQTIGSNPLGHSGFDIASYGMGLFACTDKGALERRMAAAGYVPPSNSNQHNALADAVEQGQTLAWLLNYADGVQNT